MAIGRTKSIAPQSADDLTVLQKALVAMLKAGFGQIRCTDYDDIVMEAWRLFPDEFSLRKYPQHPDASNIHKRFYAKTTKDQKLIEPCGDKRFRLTRQGLEQARDLLDIAFPEPLEKQ